MVGVRESTALHTNHSYATSLHVRQPTLLKHTPIPEPLLLPPELPHVCHPRHAARRKRSMRHFLREQLHLLTYIIIQAFFSLYICLRTYWHVVADRSYSLLFYHHRSPELIQRDVKDLIKIPQHLSIVLDLNNDQQRGTGLEGLVSEIGEVAAWCASAGIPALSVYEKTGMLKAYLPVTHRKVSQTLEAYFGPDKKPGLSLRAPNLASFSHPGTPPVQARPLSLATNGNSPIPHLTILLLSAEDGRSTLVDLAKTLTEMSQRNKLGPSDISMELIDAEITESVMGEPDLLILFGPRVELKGYPPWQIRLTEICHSPDISSVSYQTFLRALRRHSAAQIRCGR